MQLSFTIRQVYGKPLAYPDGETFFRAHMLLTQKQTLDLDDIKAYELLGHTVVERPVLHGIAK